MAEQSQACCTLAQGQSGAGLERSHQQEKENKPGPLPTQFFLQPPPLSPSQVPCPNLIYPSASCQLSFEH